MERLINELNKNTSLDGKNVDDKFQTPGENEESDYEGSWSESEDENFSDNETND